MPFDTGFHQRCSTEHLFFRIIIIRGMDRCAKFDTIFIYFVEPNKYERFLPIVFAQIFLTLVSCTSKMD